MLSVSALCKYVPGRWCRAQAHPFWLCDANIKRAENWRERFGFEGLSFQSRNSMMHIALGAAAALSFPTKQSSDFHCSHSIVQQESHLRCAPRVLPHCSVPKHQHPAVFLPSLTPSLLCSFLGEMKVDWIIIISLHLFICKKHFQMCLIKIALCLPLA